MKAKILLLFCLFWFCGLKGQNQSAALEIESQNKGFLLPRIADTNNITSPEEGLLIYDLNKKNTYVSQWKSLEYYSVGIDAFCLDFSCRYGYLEQVFFHTQYLQNIKICHQIEL
ncbi:MAG: hypothetical protein KDC53_07270 [Saprospiraceae bacterium]|nr:hypothetical protein [Saprospiraceae bacterium]